MKLFWFLPDDDLAQKNQSQWKSQHFPNGGEKSWLAGSSWHSEDCMLYSFDGWFPCHSDWHISKLFGGQRQFCLNTQMITLTYIQLTQRREGGEGRGEGGVCLNTAQIAFLCIPMLPEKPSLSPKGKRSHQALRRALYKYKFLILLFTEEKKGHFLCPLQWISCRKAVKKAICKRPLCLSPCLKDLAFLFLSDEAHCYLWWI